MAPLESFLSLMSDIDIKDVSIAEDPARFHTPIMGTICSKAAKSKAAKSAGEKMTWMKQEGPVLDESSTEEAVNEDEFISVVDDELICPRCAGMLRPQTRPKSLPITIQKRKPNMYSCWCNEINDGALSRDEAAIRQLEQQYDIATWRMYDRIKNHRRKHKQTRPLSCVSNVPSGMLDSHEQNSSGVLGRCIEAGSQNEHSHGDSYHQREEGIFELDDI